VVVVLAALVVQQQRQAVVLVVLVLRVASLELALHEQLVAQHGLVTRYRVLLALQIPAMAVRDLLAARPLFLAALELLF
jgi:hypothetical protein